MLKVESREKCQIPTYYPFESYLNNSLAPSNKFLISYYYYYYSQYEGCCDPSWSIIAGIDIYK